MTGLDGLRVCVCVLSALRNEDITQRMPRSEAAEIEAVVIREAQSICPGVICQASFSRNGYV